MIKKIILSLMIFIGIFWISDFSFADNNDGEYEAQCNISKTCFDQPTFEIDSNNFNFGSDAPDGDTAKELTNNLFETIIQKLMVGLSILSLVIITIGGYYMVAYHGDDSTLTKGKNIVKAGIVSLIVALSSYYIINLLNYILYNN